MRTVLRSPTRTWRVAELLAMPEDGVRREIIRGQLAETQRSFDQDQPAADQPELPGLWIDVGGLFLPV